MRRRTIRRSWRIVVALLTVLGTVTVMAVHHAVPIAQAANLLSNGSFDSGSTSPWFINTHNGGTSNALALDSTVHFDGTASAKVVVTNVGTGGNDWNVQLGQTGMSLTSGTTYLLTYEVQSSTANRVVRATLQQDASPFTQYANTNCALGAANTWRQCTMTFTPSGALSGVDLYFDVSQAADTVWFDAVSVQSLGTNLVSNGTFESGTSPWFLNHQNSATTSDTNVVQSADNFDPSYSGAITITNVGTGSNDWNVQLGQTGFSLTGGNTYTLYYEAKSTTASRVIRAALQQDASPFTLYQSSSCTLSSTANTWTQCSLTVTPSSNLTGVDLWFNLSQNADTVKLDDISLTGAAPGSAPTINHVFVIMMENLDWSMIKGDTTDAPYINNTLLPEASYATQYNDIGHPSLPNYLWLEGGSNFNYTTDANPTISPNGISGTHLTAQMNTAGLTWKVYGEGITDGTCPTADNNSTLYAVRHNANVYFNDVNGNNTYCTAHEKSYASDFSTDIGSESTTSRYNLILPNLCDDDHWTNLGPGCSYADTQAARVHAGDTWLSNNVPAILNSAAYKDNGLLLITWDESQTTTSTQPVGMIALSPLAKGGGYNNSVSYTHSSTLKTLEEIYGVSLLNDASSATTTDLSDLFNAGAIP